MPGQTISLVERVPHSTCSRPFSIHHTDVEPKNSSALYLHCHSELELFYLKKGHLYFYIEDKMYHLNEGEAILIPSGLLHYATKTTDEDMDCSFDALVFSPSMILDTLPSYCANYMDPLVCQTACGTCHLTHSSDWENEIIANLVSLFTFINTPVEQCELIIRGKLLVIWQQLYNNVFFSTSRSNNIEEYPLLRKCIDDIHNEYMYDFSLEELADKSCMSQGHFCRIFKEITGFTPFNYINRIRIAKSCELLTRTDKKIADISSLCGFNTISFFNRTFKEIMKETPSLYRKNFRTTRPHFSYLPEQES